MNCAVLLFMTVKVYMLLELSLLEDKTCYDRKHLLSLDTMMAADVTCKRYEFVMTAARIEDDI